MSKITIAIARNFLVVLGVYLFGLENSHYRAWSAERLNVIFILADDLGWADTSLYGHTRFYQTPNLARLAKRGMTFTQAYSASPLCSPTRSAILTGLSPARTGITTPSCHLPQVVLEATVAKAAAPDRKSLQPSSVTRLKTEYVTLAESLKAAGYTTGHFGKWHLGAEPYSPLQQGFDVDVPHHPGPGPAGSYVAPWKFSQFKEATAGEHIEDRIAREAVAFIEQHQQSPFFLNYWMFSVHAPFDAKQTLIDKHRSRVDPKDPQRSPTYAAMIESMDDAVGTLLDTLDRLKLADRTIIVFTADNGGNMYNEVDGTTPTSNAPLRGGKATLFEGGTRVPCVVAWPGITNGGSRSDTPIQSEDYYPTLLDGLGLKPAGGQVCDGMSILPALRGEAVARNGLIQYFPHETAVPDWLPPAVSIHRGDWKLIRIFHGGENGQHRYLLFNLREDLSETKNLAAEQPAKVRELDELISVFLRRTEAVLPQPNPRFDPKQYRADLEGQARPKDKPSTKARTNDDGDPALKGWKARSCQAKVMDGVLKISQVGTNSFLGFAAGKHSGTSTIKFRVKSHGGQGHIDWLPGGVQSTPQSQPFDYPRSGWHEVSVTLPAQGPLGIVRIYLPPGSETVEFDWIEIVSPGGTKPSLADF